MPEEIRLGAIEDLRKSGSLKFNFKEEGISREGFLLWFDGAVLAFENVCRHIPISLDYGDGRFMSADGRHIVCQTHGATYEPLTGVCVAGPCPGAKLRKLNITLRDGVIYLLV